MKLIASRQEKDNEKYKDKGRYPPPKAKVQFFKIFKRGGGGGQRPFENEKGKI